MQKVKEWAGPQDWAALIDQANANLEPAKHGARLFSHAASALAGGAVTEAINYTYPYCWSYAWHAMLSVLTLGYV